MEEQAMHLSGWLEDVQWPAACDPRRIMHVSLNDTSGLGVTVHLLAQALSKALRHNLTMVVDGKWTYFRHSGCSTRARRADISVRRLVPLDARLLPQPRSTSTARSPRTPAIPSLLRLRASPALHPSACSRVCTAGARPRQWPSLPATPPTLPISRCWFCFADFLVRDLWRLSVCM